MNSPYIRTKNKTDKLIFRYILALIPLVIFGFYKNGYLLYEKDLVSMLDMFKPIIFVLIGFELGYFIEYLDQKIIRKNSKELIKNTIFSSELLLYGFIIGMIVPPNTSYLIFILGIIISLLLIKLLNSFLSLSINYACLGVLIIVILISAFSNFSYSNIFELSESFVYSVKDLFIGKSIGGLSSTNNVLSIVGLLFLGLTNNHKINISISAIITYSLLLVGTCLIKELSLNEVFIQLFTNNYLFGVIFIAPIYMVSPLKDKGCILYGVLISILFYILLLFIPGNIAIFITILIMSLLVKMIDKNKYLS